MSILNEIDFSKPKSIGIFGSSKEEKFKTLLKIQNYIKKDYNSIFITFNFNNELDSYFKSQKRLKNPNKTHFFNESISLEEQEKTLLKLFSLISNVKNDKHFFIFVDETILIDKLIYLLKLIKFKKISLVFASSGISKTIFLLTDEKIYGKTLSPIGIDLIQNKTKVDREKIKNLEENEYIYKMIGGDIKIEKI